LFDVEYSLDTWGRICWVLVCDMASYHLKIEFLSSLLSFHKALTEYTQTSILHKFIL